MDRFFEPVRVKKVNFVTMPEIEFHPTSNYNQTDQVGKNFNVMQTEKKQSLSFAYEMLLVVRILKHSATSPCECFM